jgi:DNA-binding transcriptional MerR regulator
MFKIGDFSRIARVSCRLLRYYDELGLLKPAIVDRVNGYRYYTAAQLPQLNRILVLKDLGLTLEQIEQVLAENLSADQLRAMLMLRRADIEQTLAAEAGRLRMIESRISQLDEEGRLSADDVLIRDEPDRTVLTARTTVRSFAEARGIIQQLAQSAPRRVPRAALGSIIGILHSSEFEPDLLDVELGYILNPDERYEGPGDAGVTAAGLAMRVRELPGAERMAVCVRVGLPEHAHLITARIGQFVENNRYVLAGPGREVFLQTPLPDRMEESVVEMQFPIELREA